MAEPIILGDINSISSQNAIKELKPIKTLAVIIYAGRNNMEKVAPLAPMTFLVKNITIVTVSLGYLTASLYLGSSVAILWS